MQLQNRMDMGGMMDMGGDTIGGMMKPWLHFTSGDTLYFRTWVPKSPGAVIGACIGLFLLALIERWVTAMRAVMQKYWARKAEALLAARMSNKDARSSSNASQQRFSSDTKEMETESLPILSKPITLSRTLVDFHRTTPFILSHDIARGAIYACQVALGYALMLSVMSFNAGYIVAVTCGLATGEVLFGRFRPEAAFH